VQQPVRPNAMGKIESDHISGGPRPVRKSDLSFPRTTIERAQSTSPHLTFSLDNREINSNLVEPAGMNGPVNKREITILVQESLG
jgi:hypothetical protein